MTISASAPIRFVVLLTSIGLALLLLLTGAVVANAADGGSVAGPVVEAVVTHEVRPGETLWGIATAYGDPTGDVRHTIHEIRAANGLQTSEIQVGQVLVVPVDF